MADNFELLRRGALLSTLGKPRERQGPAARDWFSSTIQRARVFSALGPPVYTVLFKTLELPLQRGQERGAGTNRRDHLN